MEGMVLGDIVANQIGNVISKALYENFTSSFPPLKVVSKFEED